MGLHERCRVNGHAADRHIHRTGHGASGRLAARDGQQYEKTPGPSHDTSTRRPGPGFRAITLVDGRPSSATARHPLRGIWLRQEETRRLYLIQGTGTVPHSPGLPVNRASRPRRIASGISLTGEDFRLSGFGGGGILTAGRGGATRTDSSRHARIMWFT